MSDKAKKAVEYCGEPGLSFKTLNALYQQSQGIHPIWNTDYKRTIITPENIDPEFFNYFENNLQELQKTARGEFEEDDIDEEPKQLPAEYGLW